MSTSQIYDLVNQDPMLKNAFLGVFPRDLLHNIRQRPVCLIANTDDSTQQGQHWVAFYLDPHNNIEYFDSFGLPPYVQSFHDFVIKNNTKG